MRTLVIHKKFQDRRKNWRQQREDGQGQGKGKDKGGGVNKSKHPNKKRSRKYKGTAGGGISLHQDDARAEEEK